MKAPNGDGREYDDCGDRPGGAAAITVYQDGPYLIRGDFSIHGQQGETVPAGRRTVALCRCGKSRTRPFCDGTHRLVGFQAPGAAEVAAAPVRAPVSARARPVQAPTEDRLAVGRAEAALHGARALLLEAAAALRGRTG
ncbi:MAG: CDGSH iron-sulfur domain-containing protein [Solirubrobacteraceae bacterium]